MILPSMAETSSEKRKSVSFSDGAVVFDEHGEQSTQSHNEKITAESHSTKTDDTAPAEGADADFSTELKKKKKKSKSKTDGDDENDDAANADQDDTFDGAALKEMKKKKKKSKDDGAVAGEDDLDAAVLKELKRKKKEKKEKKDKKKDKKADGESQDADDDDSKEESGAQEGDMELGTGIWAHENVTPIAYDLLLSRFFILLHATNPGFASGSEKNFKIPPPECRREGNKKTIFANINEISARVKRTMEHVMSFLFTELGTSGSVDGAQRLVIKGRYQQKQLENVLIRYISELSLYLLILVSYRLLTICFYFSFPFFFPDEYVLCKTCRSVDTELEKGENRLHFVRCNKCGSRRSVAAIKSGFSAQIGRRKRTA